MKQILYDFIYPHSALAFVFYSCIVALAHTHIDERDKERERILKREIWKWNFSKKWIGKKLKFRELFESLNKTLKRVDVDFQNVWWVWYKRLSVG